MGSEMCIRDSTGDSIVLVDLMLSPHSQTLDFIVAALAVLDKQSWKPEGATRTWLERVRQQMAAMQQKGLLPFNADPLLRRMRRVVSS